MNKSEAWYIYRTWRAQFEPESTWPVMEAHAKLSQRHPHLYPPQVPETFRGPKWGKL
ncbi:hypothetical protein [Streptomyces sp. MH60]|uniref:hypothetical protein n=1 Tax=Streptomyces sp. MH60 TaxID=1940758 RepID=UPI000D4B4FB2|nr:hypothetical protein [Streptomyces sp. MH60]PPS86444.1 hypothetical protein BZZ08_03411 [Streptomyces sp. MH60]